MVGKLDELGSIFLFGSIFVHYREQVTALFVIACRITCGLCIFLTFDEDMAFVDGLPAWTMSILFNVVRLAIAPMI